jgi:hypothetical protein
MLSPGAFVIHPRAVQAVGVENLHALNRSVPAFAVGGLVGHDPLIRW